MVPFLDPVAVDRLREQFHRLDAEQTADSAYHHELWGTDDARKDAVADLLADEVGAALDRVSLDYVARTRAFIRKRPGESTAVPPHVDISFVDETRFRSVMVWCSLGGHGEGDGIVHVVPGSHRLRPGVRAHRDDASTFPDLLEDIVERWGVPVPLASGEAVVFDHGIVHYAEPNRGHDERLTLQCVCTPAEADLHYPVPAGPGRARVHRVDEVFYRRFPLNETPSDGLLARYPVVEEVDVPTVRLVRDDFASVVRAGR